MELLTIRETKQIYAFPKDIGLMFGRKAPSRLLTSFRAFCDSRPNYFNPITKPYVDMAGSGTQYNVLAFAHYYENKDLLDAGSRSINFKADLGRLKEVYG